MRTKTLLASILLSVPALSFEPDLYWPQRRGHDGQRVSHETNLPWKLHGNWEVENLGIAPDVEVENDPKSVAEGRDPQLERAVEITLEALKNHPVSMPRRPKYPNYHTPSGNP